MQTRGITMLPLALAGVLLLTAGCVDREEQTPAEAAARPSIAAPSPTPDTKAELLDALQRSQRVAHRYAVQGDLPEGQRVEGSGSFDPKARRFAATYEITGGGKKPDGGRRTVIGTDSYVRPVGDREWVHLDLKRVKPDSIVYFDMTDPTGLVAFTERISTAYRAGPHAYSGSFAMGLSGIDPYLPVGAPSIVSLGMNSGKYTIATDAQGWVTRISVELEPSDGPKLAMTTRMSDHGKPLRITAPPKAKTAEADPFYYRK